MWRVVLFVIISVIVQLVILYVGFNTSMKLPSVVMWPGLASMRFLPADAASAGSFIVFPTALQVFLALAVNTVFYAGIWLLAGVLQKSVRAR
jgi:hypothetical protein